MDRIVSRVGDGELNVLCRHIAADHGLVRRISRDGGRGHLIRFFKDQPVGIVFGGLRPILKDIVNGQVIIVAHIVDPDRCSGLCDRCLREV